MTHSSSAKTAQPHIPARTYLIVFGWLAVMTAIEVLVAASALPESIKVSLLVTVAIIKAALVVLYYMHLRYDSFWYWIILLVPVFFVLLLGRYLILR
ncbi:MAG: cytochrome C oxidase subunit IV family protein [Anaerolineales bacterium]|nr:cytochrome C oxidase subunit IV family protein [Anaerolineales bacterium]